MGRFLRDNWLWIALPFVLVLGGMLVILLLGGDEGVGGGDGPMTDERENHDSPQKAGALAPSKEGNNAEGPVERDLFHQPETEDQFYQGVIAWVHWGHERGAIRTASGREVHFEFPFVNILGERRSVESLHAGMRVGFDVGQTSSGLRVTTLKVYD